jgi:hypothetical protein
MIVHEGRSFDNARIDLDGAAFRNCRFTGCEMVYSGGQPPEITGCHFDDCSWSFGGSAALTLGFLSAMHGGGFADLVERTFEMARQGRFADLPASAAGSATPAGPVEKSDAADRDHPLMFRIPRVLKRPLRR